MNATVKKNKTREIVVRMLAGAVFGATVMSLFLAFVGKPHLDLNDPATAVTVIAGVCYLLIGLSVGLGLMAPRIGARFLNVEDSEELIEERHKLKPASIVFVLSGAFLLVLALSGGETAVFSRAAALSIAILCMAGIVIAAMMGSKHTDEMTRQMGHEVASFTLQAAFLLIGGWAALAQLGYVAWMGPLALLSSLALLQLFVTFVVIGRRGMLIRS